MWIERPLPRSTGPARSAPASGAALDEPHPASPRPHGEPRPRSASERSGAEVHRRPPHRGSSGNSTTLSTSGSWSVRAPASGPGTIPRVVSSDAEVGEGVDHERDVVARQRGRGPLQLEVEVGLAAVARVAEAPDDLTPGDHVADRHRRRPGHQVEVRGVDPAADVEHDEVAAEVGEADAARQVGRDAVGDVGHDRHDGAVGDRQHRLVVGQVVVVPGRVTAERRQHTRGQAVEVVDRVPAEPVDGEALAAVDPAADRQHHVAVVVVRTAAVARQPVGAGEGRPDHHGRLGAGRDGPADERHRLLGPRAQRASRTRGRPGRTWRSGDGSPRPARRRRSRRCRRPGSTLFGRRGSPGSVPAGTSMTTTVRAARAAPSTAATTSPSGPSASVSSRVSVATRGEKFRTSSS